MGPLAAVQHWELAVALTAAAVAAALALRFGVRLLPRRRVDILTGQAMGTYYRVSLVLGDKLSDLASLDEGVRTALERVESLMSTYRPESELSQFNAARSTDWIAVSPELAFVVGLALDVGSRREGCYDVTIGPLVNLWSFGPDRRPPQAPSEEEIAAARARVGLQWLEARSAPPSLRKKRPDVCVDLASVAKGFGVDQVAELLDRCAVRDYCVDVGGEVRARGTNARRTAWQVAIERPIAGERSLARIVPLDGRAMATSGDYRNYFEEHGVRYGHIIDCRTGRPVRHALGSVTVVDRSCATADAWATALFVAGPEQGYQLALRHGLPALFVTRTTKAFVEKHTPAMAPLLKM